MLIYILKNIVLQQRMALQTNFWIFINKILDYEVINNVVNEISIICINFIIMSIILLLNSHYIKSDYVTFDV